MNVIVPSIVTGLTTLKDGTVKLSLSLQEVQPEAAARLFQLMNQFVKVYITTDGITQDAKNLLDEWEIDNESKSQSKRIRNVLYRLWEQDNSGYDDFELFYKNRTEKIIQQIKDKLD